MKVKCTKCKTEKNESDFYKDMRRPQGLQSNCKKCFVERNTKYKKTEAGKNTTQKSILKNIEEIRRKLSLWRKSKEGKLWWKNYRQSEKHIKYRRVYNKLYSKRDYVKEKNKIHFYKYKMRKLNQSDGTVTFEEINRILKDQNYLCNMCKKDLREIKKHLDHIYPISLGGLHSINNVQWLCYVCNIKKSNKIV